MISPKRSLLVVAALAAISTTSYATPIFPGTSVLAVPVLPLSGGASVFDTSTVAFAGKDAGGNIKFTGVETSTDFTNDTNNSLGGLTFIYNLSNDLSSLEAIDRVTLSGFAGFAADVGFIDPGGTFTPVAVTRSGLVDGGDVIGFDYNVPFQANHDIAPGGASAYMVIRTDAPFDTPITMAIQDGANGTVASIGPTRRSGTPEPASLGIIGLGGVALLRRRRS